MRLTGGRFGGSSRWCAERPAIISGLAAAAAMVAAVLLIAGPAHATPPNVCTWNGSASQNISDNANWTATSGSCGAGSGTGTAQLLGAQLVFPATVPAGGSQIMTDAAESPDDIVLNNGYSFTVTNSITLSGLDNGRVAIDATNGSADFQGAVTLGADQTWTAGTGKHVTVDGAVSGSHSLTVAGGGTVTLNTASYTGATMVAGGTLMNGAANALPVTTVLDVQSGATFDLNGFPQQVASVTDDTGTITDSGSSANLTIGNLSGDDAVGEKLTGSLGLTVDGNGNTLTLTNGQDSFTGPTTVSSGTLDVTGDLSGTTVAIDAGATLEGNGTVGSIGSNAGDVLPGTPNTPGILNASGPVNLGSAGGSFDIEINGANAYSQLASTSTVDMGGATLRPTDAYAAPYGTVFTIITGNAVSGTLDYPAGTPLANGAIITTSGGRSLLVGYGPNSVTLTDVTDTPSNVSPPTISGKAQDGQTLTEHQGSWTNSPTSYSYQWLSCDSSGNNCSEIPGATDQTYTLTASDVGHTVEVQETAANNGGASAARSAQSAIVAPPVIAATTQSVDGVSSTAATLHGIVETKGVAVTWQFQLGNGLPYQNSTPVQTIATGHGAVPVTWQVTNLQPLTVYHFRLVAITRSISGVTPVTADGHDLAFITQGTGLLLLRSSRLKVVRNLVSVPLKCKSSLPCRGSFSISIKTKLGKRKRLRSLVCATRAFGARAKRDKRLKARISAFCLAVLRHSRSHRIRAQFASAPTSSQFGFIQKITLSLVTPVARRRR